VKNTLAMFLFLWLGVGCSDGKEDVSAAADTGTEAAEDNWWEDDETPDDDDEPDDGDDDDKPDDSFLLFEVGVSLATGTGGFEGHYGECEFTGAIVDATEADACDDCSMAMSVTYASVSYTGDDCDDLDDLEGSTEIFGHGTVELIDIEGLSIHALYGFDEDETPEWAAVDGGYSLLIDGMWYFGIEL